jgi:predicted ATPase/DNA-binding CsgD family transcriptional regulator
LTHTNLPVQLTSFIGREREISDVQRLLFNLRLVTLTGASGSGKTRLALQVTKTMGDTFDDGMWLVDLAPLREPALVPELVGQALGLRPIVDQPQMETLLGFIRSKQLLLILDNCEHLSEACAQLALRLLTRASELRILATSRVALGIPGETIYSLSGLDWPVVNSEVMRNLDLQDLMGYDAVHLFIERARSISPNFNLNRNNALSIIEICRRLDGLPLALELASTRVNVLTVQDIIARLNDRFSLLTSAQGGGFESRHATLRAAIDWSYALLTVNEQTFLRRLAVFPAGWTIDMVEAVCSGEGIDKGRMLNLLSSLVKKSLIVADTTSHSQARYRLLETIREYALEKLVNAGESEQLRDRHLALFLSRAEEASPKLGEAYQQLWLNWLESERDNLRAALVWSLEDGGVSRRVESGLRIASALVRFWEIRGSVQEGMAWFERLFAQTDERISPVVRVNALVFASFLAMLIGDAQASLTYSHEAVEVAEGMSGESNPALTFALTGLASGARASGDYHAAFTIGERVIQLLRDSSGDSFYLGMGLLGQGDVAIQLGYYDTARERLDESLSLAQFDGDSFRIAHTLNTLGDLARCEQNYTEAQKDYEKGAALLRELGAEHDLASILCNLGHTYLHLGDVEYAQTFFRESMAIHQVQQNRTGMTECLIGIAGTAVNAGEPSAGARLLAFASANSGEPTASVWLATRMEADRYLELAQSSLSEAEFKVAQAAGRAMSLEQAVDFAQNLLSRLKIELSIEEAPDSLTRREREVVKLLAHGKSNGEIAIELVLSKRTVETHVSKVLSKLGLSTRAQVMRWAIEHGLT